MTALVARHAVARSGPPKVWAIAAFGAAFAGVFVANYPTMGIVGLVVLTLMVAMFVRPDMTTLVVIFLIMINAPSVLVTKYGVPQTAAAVVPILLFIPLAVRLLRRESLVLTSVFGILVVYFIFQLVGSIISPDTSLSLKHVETFVLEGVLSYFLVTNVIRTRAEVKKATWVVLVGLGFLGALTLVQAVTQRYYSTFFGFAHTSDDFFFGQVPSPRFQGPIGDPNYFAQILVIGVPLGLALAATGETVRRRTIAIVLTGFCMAGIVLTYSRGAAVALVFVLIGMVGFRVVRSRYLLLAVLGIAIAIAAIPSYRARVASLGSVQGANAAQGSSSASSDQSVRERATELRAAILAYSDHPVFGVGPSAFPLVYQHYALATGGEVHNRIKFGPLKGTIPERQAHDLFLSVATDGGTIQIALFLAMILATWRVLLRGRRAARAVGDLASAAIASGYLVATIGFLTAGLFLSLAYERYYWLLLALAMVAGRAAADSRQVVPAVERAVAREEPPPAEAEAPGPPTPKATRTPPAISAARSEIVRLLLRTKGMTVDDLAESLGISVDDAEGIVDGRVDIATREDVDRALALGEHVGPRPFYALALAGRSGIELLTAGGTQPLFADAANGDRVAGRLKRVSPEVVVVPVAADYAWRRFAAVQAAAGREAEPKNLFLADRTEIGVARDEILHELGEAMAGMLRLLQGREAVIDDDSWGFD